MSHNITKYTDFYNWLIDIKNIDFSDKSILLIGAGSIAEQYAIALQQLGIKNITVISKTEKSLENFCRKFNCKGYSGGYENNLSKIGYFDLVIVATPVSELLSCARSAISNGQNNILVEKPGNLYKNELEKFEKYQNDFHLRIAYNRLVYPNFIKLKSILETEEISSCIFSITERGKEIPSLKKDPEILSRWGIANSLHVLSMVVSLIGFPEKIASYTSGKLSWHPSGSIFVGGGISAKNIPFSFHGDWESPGGWSIEIITNKNRYRLKPLESLCYLNKFDEWEKIDFNSSFPNLKFGMAEEIAIMLYDNQKFSEFLPSIKRAKGLILFAESIFGYS